MSFDLRIQQTYGRIGLNITNAQMTMEQPKADLQIKQENTQVRVETELPTVLIDQYQCFAEAGLKNNGDLTADYAARGRAAAIEAIGRIASDGDAFMGIESRTNAVAQLDAAAVFAPPVEFNYGTMPNSRPRIEVTGRQGIEWEPNQLNIEARPNKPIINATRPSLEVYLQQRPNLTIEYIGRTVDQRV